MKIEEYVKREANMRRLKEAVRDATKPPEDIEIEEFGETHVAHSHTDKAMEHLKEQYDYVSRRPSLSELHKWHQQCWKDSRMYDGADEDAIGKVAMFIVGRLYEEADMYGGAKPIMQEWLEEYRREIERLEDASVE